MGRRQTTSRTLSCSATRRHCEGERERERERERESEKEREREREGERERECVRERAPTCSNAEIVNFNHGQLGNGWHFGSNRAGFAAGGHTDLRILEYIYIYIHICIYIYIFI